MLVGTMSEHVTCEAMEMLVALKKMHRKLQRKVQSLKNDNAAFERALQISRLQYDDAKHHFDKEKNRFKRKLEKRPRQRNLPVVREEGEVQGHDDIVPESPPRRRRRLFDAIDLTGESDVDSDAATVAYGSD